MSWIGDILKNLTRQLLPVGRAFTFPVGGFLDRLNNADAKRDVIFYNDCVSILDSILPDNANFTIEDAKQWFVRLGIIYDPSLTLTQMKDAIIQKMAYPGNVAPRCSAEYITEQLQTAGFNVKVYENIFYPGPVTKTPSEILGVPEGLAEYNAFEYGEVYYGEGWHTGDDDISIVANHIEESGDDDFDIPPLNYRSTFYIADPAGITTFATVPAIQKDQFRQLILQLKPQQTVGILFVEYI